LVVGSTGACETIFAVQTLAHGVRLEPGLLLTFEESPKDRAHARGARGQARHDEIASALAETHTRITSLRGDENRKKAELRLLKESSKAGAAAGAANLAVLRRLRGAEVAPKKARPSSVGPALPTWRQRSWTFGASRPGLLATESW
jgi:hypothetical protein